MNWLALLPFLILSTNALFNIPSSSSFITSLMKKVPLTNCAVSSLSLPECALPHPSDGLHLQFVTLGRGTQNYTCASSDASTPPQSIGATATLFDASCVAAADRDILRTLPDLLKRFPLSGADLAARLVDRVTGQSIAVGKHYFTSGGSPFFDLRQAGSKDDWVRAKKTASVDAPVQPGYGDTENVAWLQLTAVEGGIREVYRVQTAGGNPPDTCLGMPKSFTVDYMAEYWFYA